jgi:predicted RNase H-like nuclease (RuvC/YqgF family)
MCYKAERSEKQVRDERIKELKSMIRDNRESAKYYRSSVKSYMTENKELRAELKALQPVRKARAKGFPVEELGYTITAQPVETVSIEG